MTTLAQILDLAEQARRSPHARRVLFDALIDRYGDLFLGYVERTQELADRLNVRRVLILRPDRLVLADRAWLTGIERGTESRAAGSRFGRHLPFASYDWDLRPWSGERAVFVALLHPRTEQRRRP